ncbi:MAG: O-antigen ligase family protein [Flavobacteriaceae bacterium]|nr:O-antigen ligase family protein [Flavobacteriaceae bacterium]
MSAITRNKSEVTLLLLHAIIGVVLFTVPFSAMLYSLVIVIVAFFYIFSAEDKTYAILVSAAYLAASDVFLRMTGGLVFYELHKYLLIIFAVIGTIYSLHSSKGFIYLVCAALLLVGVVFTEFNVTESVRKMIMFNLSGAISLCFFAFFCFKKQISIQQLNKVLFYALLPIVAMLVYMFLSTPDLKSVITGTASNHKASGGFGPNQVATILGFGIFILMTRLLLHKFKKTQLIVEFSLLALVTFRGLATFSRGGIIAAFIATIVFMLLIYFRGNIHVVRKIFKMIFFFVIAGIGVWFYTVSQTSGMIENRYLNKNAAGVEKADITTGRGDLIAIELQAFFENPIFGIGVGKSKQYRLDRTGTLAASHNEMSRLVSEHGVFGIVSFLILFLTPLLLRLQVRNNIYFYSFFLLWLLTINHSAMRIAFPSFIYGLALLDVTYENKKNKISVSK